MELVDQAAVIADLTRRARIGEKCAEDFGGPQILGRIANDEIEAEGPGACLDHANGLGMRVAVDEERASWRLDQPLCHRHGFRRRGAFIEKRGAGKLKSGEVDDHLLEIEQGFEAALAHLGLIGRIGCVPAGVFEDVAQNDFGRDGAVITHTDHRGENLVARSDLAQIGERRAFGHAFRQIERLRSPDLLRDDLADEILER